MVKKYSYTNGELIKQDEEQSDVLAEYFLIDTGIKCSNKKCKKILKFNMDLKRFEKHVCTVA